jgi:uncharacterized protein (TIGR03032 family)
MSQPPLAPFSCVHTPEIPDLLASLGCSLALTTYQAGKVIVLSAGTDDNLLQLPRTFAKPMGMAVSGPRMAIATREAVVILRNVPGLAASYPRQPNTYDSLFVPRALYATSELDLHDMAWGTDGLWAVNTRFSCLSLIDEAYSFLPRWHPPSISALTPDDRCHLNGMELQDGVPRYVTALGTTDTPGGWREHRLHGGVLLDVPSGEPILSGLPMPHSPRLYDGKLYVLLSATGELAQVDSAGGRFETVARLPGFARGMSRLGDFVFIGISRVRKRHMFSDMPVAKQKPFSGIVSVHLPTGRLAGSIQYLSSCEEIYDVQVLPGLRRPGLLNLESPHALHALVTPETSYWGKPKDDPPPESPA